MFPTISVGLICLTLVYLAHLVQPLLERLVGIQEQAHRPAVLAKPVELPSALEGMLSRWPEGWARDQTREAMVESYHELGSWDKVSAAYSQEGR